MFWIAAGILTGQFERDERTRELSVSEWLAITARTGLAAGLPWQLLEQMLYSTARPALLENVHINWDEALGDGAVMVATMMAYRFASYFVD